MTGTNLKPMRPEAERRVDLTSVTFSGWPSRNLRHDLVVDVGAGLDQLLAPLARDLLLRSAGISIQSYFCPFDSSSKTAAFILMRSTMPRWRSSSPSGHWMGTGLRSEPLLHASRRTSRKSAPDLVHLVHERDAGNAVLVGLAPHRLALRLDAVAAVEHRDRAVEHAQAALDLDGEVDVPGRVDDVDAVADARRTAPRSGVQKQFVAAR